MLKNKIKIYLRNFRLPVLCILGISSSRTSWPSNIGPIICPETSATNLQTTPRNVPEEGRPQKCILSPRPVQYNVFVFLWLNTRGIIFAGCIKWLVYVMQMAYAFCASETEFLNVLQINSRLERLKQCWTRQDYNVVNLIVNESDVRRSVFLSAWC